MPMPSGRLLWSVRGTVSMTMPMYIGGFLSGMLLFLLFLRLFFMSRVDCMILFQNFELRQTASLLLQIGRNVMCMI